MKNVLITFLLLTVSLLGLSQSANGIKEIASSKKYDLSFKFLSFNDKEMTFRKGSYSIEFHVFDEDLSVKEKGTVNVLKGHKIIDVVEVGADLYVLTSFKNGKIKSKEVYKSKINLGDWKIEETELISVMKGDDSFRGLVGSLTESETGNFILEYKLNYSPVLSGFDYGFVIYDSNLTEVWRDLDRHYSAKQLIRHRGDVIETNNYLMVPIETRYGGYSYYNLLVYEKFGDEIFKLSIEKGEYTFKSIEYLVLDNGDLLLAGLYRSGEDYGYFYKIFDGSDLELLIDEEIAFEEFSDEIDLSRMKENLYLRLHFVGQFSNGELFFTGMVQSIYNSYYVKSSIAFRLDIDVEKASYTYSKITDLNENKESSRAELTYFFDDNGKFIIGMQSTFLDGKKEKTEFELVYLEPDSDDDEVHRVGQEYQPYFLEYNETQGYYFGVLNRGTTKLYKKFRF